MKAARQTAPGKAADGAIETVRAIHRAYEAKDRAAAERLIADDFRFFSPLDNGLDRRKYFISTRSLSRAEPSVPRNH